LGPTDTTGPVQHGDYGCSDTVVEKIEVKDELTFVIIMQVYPAK
jgi:hypothetical protein